MSFRSPSSDSDALQESPDVPPSARRRIAILVDEVAENEAATGELAAPVQSTGCIIDALKQLGYTPVEVVLQPNKTDEWLTRLTQGDFQLAFNLCETVAGRADGEHLPAAVIELLELPMTGAPSATLLYCLDKDRASAVLRSHGVPVPDWKLVRLDDPAPYSWNRFPAIVKPAAQDASNGVHSSSVVRSRPELFSAVDRTRTNWGGALVQEYIAGREINLAIVGRYVLPPSEIDFSELPDGSPPIVSFDAKWNAGSAEDLGTRPICPAPLDRERAEQLQRLAIRAWESMDGLGYARVDVRLSHDGEPYVIDVNPNPDLSPDAGLARQARAACWSYEQLIEKILEGPLSPSDQNTRSEWVLVSAQPAFEGVS